MDCPAHVFLLHERLRITVVTVRTVPVQYMQYCTVGIVNTYSYCPVDCPAHVFLLHERRRITVVTVLYMQYGTFSIIYSIYYSKVKLH